eukprot:8308865-Pyramimonas_sp.AAC.1
MKGGSFSKRVSRLSAAHIRFLHARVSRIERGSFSKRGPRRNAAYTRCKKLPGLHGFPSSTCQKWCFERILDYAGATVMLVLCVEVPSMAFWH